MALHLLRFRWILKFPFLKENINRKLVGLVMFVFLAVNHFTNNEKITFVLLKASLPIRHWWETYNNLKEDIFKDDPLWEEFMELMTIGTCDGNNYVEVNNSLFKSILLHFILCLHNMVSRTLGSMKSSNIIVGYIGIEDMDLFEFKIVGYNGIYERTWTSLCRRHWEKYTNLLSRLSKSTKLEIWREAFETIRT